MQNNKHETCRKHAENIRKICSICHKYALCAKNMLAWFANNYGKKNMENMHKIWHKHAQKICIMC